MENGDIYFKNGIDFSLASCRMHCVKQMTLKGITMLMTVVAVSFMIFALICVWSALEIYLAKQKEKKQMVSVEPLVTLHSKSY